MDNEDYSAIILATIDFDSNKFIDPDRVEFVKRQRKMEVLSGLRDDTGLYLMPVKYNDFIRYCK